MRYLWEVLLEAKKEKIAEKNIRFVHAPFGSAYMELALPCLNQTLLKEQLEEETEEVCVEVNTCYRFDHIFYGMFPPDLHEFVSLRESLTNLILHVLAHNDMKKGLTKEEYYKKFLAEEILAGEFGETAKTVFSAMNDMEQDKLLCGWLNLFQAGNTLHNFLDMMQFLVPESIVYHNHIYPEEILIYINFKKTRKTEQRIRFLTDTFLDLNYHTEIFYEHHFGIIGVEETMYIDEIAIY